MVYEEMEEVLKEINKFYVSNKKTRKDDNEQLHKWLSTRILVIRNSLDSNTAQLFEIKTLLNINETIWCLKESDNQKPQQKNNLLNENIAGTFIYLYTYMLGALLPTLVTLTNYMREDSLFKELFKGFSFGGSSYKKLKVTGTKEFDIDFFLVLPDCNECQVKNCSCVSVKPSSNYPGYFVFKIQESCCPSVYQKFCYNGRMQTDLVFNWMKSLIYKSLNRMKNENTITTFEEDDTTEEKWIFSTERKPSLTIRVYGKFGSFLINITAAFKIDPKYWPGITTGFEENLTNQKHFSIVPASPQHGSDSCWRPHFQAQEKKILKKKERLRPALRLLKLMRSNLNHRISSYMLETLALEEADLYEWQEKSLSETFMILLEKYVDCLGQPPRISYYWYSEVNLLEGINPETLSNHHNEIKKLYNKIKREYKTNPNVVAEVILKKGSDDYKDFMDYWECPEVWREFASFFLHDSDDSDDDDSTSYSLQTTDSTVAATAVGVVGALAVGALLFNAFSNRRQRPRD